MSEWLLREREPQLSQDNPASERLRETLTSVRPRFALHPCSQLGFHGLDATNSLTRSVSAVAPLGHAIITASNFLKLKFQFPPRPLFLITSQKQQNWHPPLPPTPRTPWFLPNQWGLGSKSFRRG